MKRVGILPPAYLLGVLAILFGGTFLLLILWRFLWGDPTPQFSLTAHNVALANWNAAAPPDYNLAVQVRGSQPATYEVQVRGGEARAAFRNQAYLPQRRSHETWSVDGMFATLAQDVQRLAAAEQAKELPPFHLRVAFDPQLGYPAHYRRSEYSMPIEVMWDVVKFEPVPAGTTCREK